MRFADASLNRRRKSREVEGRTHGLDQLKARQREADDRATANTNGIHQLSDFLEKYANKLIKAEASLAQVRDERDAEMKYAKDE